MSVRLLLIINAIYVALVAAVALLAPAMLLETNGLQVTVETTGLQRALGGAVVGLALISWLMRNAPTSEARRAFLLGSGVGYLALTAAMIVNHIALYQDGRDIVGPGLVYMLINIAFGVTFLYYASREKLALA